MQQCYGADDEMSWNQLYQERLKLLSTVDVIASSAVLKVEASEVGTGPDVRNLTTIQEGDEEKEADDAATVETDLHAPSTNTPDRTVKDEVLLPSPSHHTIHETVTGFCQLKSVFYTISIRTATLIIDEYCLPDELKTIRPYSTSSSNSNSADVSGDGARAAHQNPHLKDPISGSYQLYKSSGLLFYVVDSSTSEVDHRPDELRLVSLAARDDFNRKVAANEQRNTYHMQSAIDRVRRRHALASSTIDSTDDHRNNQGPSSSTHWLPINTLLSVAVDYAGFRVVVISPIPNKDSPQLALGTVATTSSSPSSEPPTSSSGPPILEKYVNSLLPPEKAFLESIAQELHLDMYQRRYPISEVEEEEEKELTHDLKACRTIDHSLYILGLKTLFPPDLPRPNTNDVRIRQLRPSYIARFDLMVPVYADILQMSNTNTSAALDPTVAKHQPIDESFWVNATASGISMASALYEKQLPKLASLLDDLAVIHMDSYSFTEWLHANGVNCRHMGILLSLCTTISVRQLLLSEALSRCAKSILNSTLRQQARKSRAEMMRAQHRGKSSQQHYIEVRDDLLLQRKQVVLELFNKILGWGDASDAFWNGETV